MGKTTRNPKAIDWKDLHVRLAEADMVYWLMPPLIVLLIIGTVSQRWIGLFEAHQTYFASFVIWTQIFSLPIPLPGGYVILGLLTLNLTAKFLFKSEWSLKKSGIILAHLGTLTLLIGGLITSITAQERYMVLPEGGETPFIYHYTKRDLMIFENNREIAKLPYQTIKNWNQTSLPFNIEILSICDNCEILKREEANDYDDNHTYNAMAQFMALTPKDKEKEPEANLTGFEFLIKGTDNDGHYIAFDGMPKSIKLSANGNNYEMIFGKRQYTLPFSITLKDFVKDDYEGTSMARNYHSDIVINDAESEDLKWETRIEMNKPLRYKGYTFFQSSFDQSPNGEISIFSVVKNEGWLFPYIGTIVLGLGLLLHVVISFARKRI